MGGHSDRRQFARYLIQLPLLHKSGAIGPAKVGVGWTRNLSEGGTCAELAERLPVQMPLCARLQTDRGPVEVEGRVVWGADSAPTAGGILHGVAFSPLTPERRRALRELTRLEGEMRLAGVRLPLDVPITCRPEGQVGLLLRGRTGNLSRGGVLLGLPELLPIGTVVALTLHTPHGALTAQGAVVWTDPPDRRASGELIRHGLRFTVLGWSTTLSLGLVLADAT